MSDCASRFEELIHERDVVLDEDLAALQRLPERTRVERYNTIKASEEEFVWEFSEECSEFLTEDERARARGGFRLARLLIAASFYDEGSVPRAMADDFIDAELQAVVDFDRYKQFDALSEEQIEEKIRRMEGEVYELVEEYTSTQIANVDDLIENPDVQQDVIERLVERYDERREKIRHGFFVYVETHGLEHMVAAIEEAVTAVADAADERQQVRTQLHEELQDISETIDERFEQQRRDLAAEIRDLESDLASRQVDPETVRAELDRLTEGADEASIEASAEEVSAQIERTSDLGQRIRVRIDDLEAVRETAREEAADEVREQTVDMVESELEKLRDQHEKIQEAVASLEREREQIEAAREALTDRQQRLEDRVAEVEQSFDGEGDGGGISGTDAVTATMARVLELDYLGRFDISMDETDVVHTQDGPFEVPDGYWEGRSERRSEWSRLTSLVGEANPDGYPTNGIARYEITSARYLGLGSETEMVIEARVLADLDAFATNGFDASPATLEDLLGVINDAVSEAEGGDHGYLLGVASPTGWSDRVREQVANDDLSRSRYSRHVSLCLVDLQDGSLVYDDSDPVARENAALFAPPVDADRVDDCVETVRREYVDDVTHQSVLLRDVVDDHGYQEHVVKRAFNALEAEGAGEQLYLDELGLSLECGA